jgi:hypothetical protein
MRATPGLGLGILNVFDIHGMHGLGDDGGADVGDTSTGIYTSTPGLPTDLSTLTLPDLTSLPTATPTLDSSIYGSLSPSQLVSVLSSIPGSTASPNPGSSSGITAGQIAAIFSGVSNSALNVYRATSSPSLIPGTNSIYNPATGQILGASLTGSEISSTIGSLLPLLLLAGGGLLLFSVMGKGR